MEKSLSRREQPLQSVDHSDWAVIREQAQMLVATNFLPAAIKTAEQAVAIILTGRELGIPTMAALRSIDVIQGKPTVSPQLMLALINRSRQLEDMKLETSPAGAVCTMKRKGRTPRTVNFGPKEAKALGLDKKDNYAKQPETMYQWRAVAACARAVFPDVILGLYTHDEMGATVDAESGELTDPPAPVHRLHAAPAQDDAPPADEAEAYAELGDQMAAATADTRETLEAEITALTKRLGFTPNALGKWIKRHYEAPGGFDGLFLYYTSDKTLGAGAYVDELVKIRDQFSNEVDAFEAAQD